MNGVIGLLLLVGLVGLYWKWILVSAFVVAAVKWGPAAWQRVESARDAERRRMAEISARADQQHAWAMAGDPRGTYGEYQPAIC